ncbi:Serine/threonine-protein kinase ssp1 [Grifola frondosa]|uniref:Serine/threonine-protein kinase ssp1 n=1 Tax=Grifola frondosa TaxID=5627 RepID=A0A1C7LNI3_GRIFR|nr:Serine/threonine-protein kinase ssp1 [Grifola frondosa]
MPADGASVYAYSARDATSSCTHSSSVLHSGTFDTDSGVVMTHEAKSSYSETYNRKMINQYEFNHRVGRGQHGEVYLATDTLNGGEQVAIKAVKRKNPKVDRMSKLRKKNLPHSPHLPLVDELGDTEHKIRKEIAIMKKLCHPHVVRLLEVIDDKLNERIYMVMEYLGGGEIKWRTANDEPVLRVEQTRRICRDVILGLEYLHHQGIIHRDIKPANLLWSADRRTVKISDFGVSHFSYAQRLAAAGKGHNRVDDLDPILMDDSDLSKTAGTPFFLAPEIHRGVVCVLEHTTPWHPRKKPQITKAIDVWAFGVTLYGLLFGTLPFTSAHEYDVYKVIRQQDWDVPPTMGSDRLPTGGRHQRPQPKGQETEGYLVVQLLDRLLQKDARKRITLDQLKVTENVLIRDPWILRGISNPQEWLRETKLDRQASLEPTADETRFALSSVVFRWSRGLHRISTLFGRVRQQRRRAPTAEDDEYKNVGVHSAPNEVQLSRHRTTTGAIRISEHHPSREKGKQRATRTEIARHKSTTDIMRTSKGFEPWQLWAGASGSDTGAATLPRRSASGRTPEISLKVPPKPSRTNSPLPSPMNVSQATTPSAEHSGQQSPEERPRSRISLSWLFGNLTPHRNRPSSHGPSPQEVRAAGLVVHTQPPSRSSEEAFGAGSKGASRQSSGSGPFSLAMRAASWGEVAEYARPSEDLTSLYSGERAEEQLDEDTLLLGAGGVAQSPLSSTPSALLSTVSSVTSLGPPAKSAALALLHRAESNEAPIEPAPAEGRASQGQARLRTTSPLAQVSYSRDGLRRSTSYDSCDDDSSFFAPRSARHSAAGSVDLQPSTSQMYQDEDEESEDDDEVHLEVRTRRPSVSTDIPPPRRSESAHSQRERAMICI